MIDLIKRKIKQSKCYHDHVKLKRVGRWIPTFHTTNGLDDEDQRTLIFECKECRKRLERTQLKNREKIVNYQEIGEDVKCSSEFASIEK